MAKKSGSPGGTDSTDLLNPLPFNPRHFKPSFRVDCGMFVLPGPRGGIGKTTTALFTHAAGKRYKIDSLLVEFDTQRRIALVHGEDAVESPMLPRKPNPDEIAFVVEHLVDRSIAALKSGVSLSVWDLGANLDQPVLRAFTQARLDDKLAAMGKPMVVGMVLGTDPAIYRPTKEALQRWRVGLPNAKFVFVIPNVAEMYTDGHVPKELDEVLGDEIRTCGALLMPDLSGRPGIVLQNARQPWHEIADADSFEVARLLNNPLAGETSGDTLKDQIQNRLSDWYEELVCLGFPPESGSAH